jgi:hypothetical protein
MLLGCPRRLGTRRVGLRGSPDHIFGRRAAADHDIGQRPQRSAQPVEDPLNQNVSHRLGAGT